MTVAPNMKVQPYLFFDGKCEEALEFYKKTLDAKVGMMMRAGESPEGKPQDVPADKIMHAGFTIGNTFIMASDGYAKGQPKFEGFCLSLSAKDEAEVKKWFDALGVGGQITQPIIKTFFSSAFGMVKDKFGVHWMILVPQEM